MKRRILLQAALAGALGMHLGFAAAASPLIEVYKNEGCGCCEGWIEHLKANGFAVKAHNVANTSDYREKFGIPNHLETNKTNNNTNKTLEGHVPASEIKRLLAERPKAKG